ncbi:hypothetical protein AZA_88703 [Nitrospirillum viridazoti Y2]|uniref:Uncharacterized protein YdaU (DUF1376 family) n=1 Tax=Nitrospirillum amazonense TaxID=28077 RepID=A0A560ITB3_9PROT|nr:DUF1376 domain-containing protein [Nitrospirillum amazonense]EGY01392.1 hypothetical protein AZA_88703 [Nitrospirillum amazonense Y2]TWB62236.1 uncharacterized protein YdaU (DUF1376 family) [Nitrospirillum amazonense]
MAQFPAIPLFTDAYLGDTTHLTTIEHGAYLLLLMSMWRTADCSLPADDKLLARYARLTTGQWARIKPTLMPFFTEEEGRIRQGRLTDEYKLVRQHSRQQSDKARSRWLKEKETADAMAMPVQCRTDAPTPTITTLEDKSSKGAEAPLTLEKRVFDLGRKLLGPKAGGQVTKLRKHHGGDLEATLRTLELAGTKSEPAAWLGAVLRSDPSAMADDVAAATDDLYRRMGVQ